MFNSKVKKEALAIHDSMLEKYNQTHNAMKNSCEALYTERGKTVELINLIQEVINSIANTPKEFGVELGKIKYELNQFRETESYAKEAYDASVKAGVNIAGAAAAGLGFASMAPSAMMSFATTFGTASTGTAIKALSGAAAQKAATAWIGRTFAGFAVKEGAGLAAGKAFLAFAGPVGWGLTAVSTGATLYSLSSKNKKLADAAVTEAKEIAVARETLLEIIEKVNDLKIKTNKLYMDLNKRRELIKSFMNADFKTLDTEQQKYLGTLVNTTLSLSELLNKTIE